MPSFPNRPGVAFPCSGYGARAFHLENLNRLQKLLILRQVISANLSQHPGKQIPLLFITLKILLEFKSNNIVPC